MPDVPNNITTPAAMTLGGTYEGTLETNGDRDWVRIDLTKGTTVQVNVNAATTNPVSDPYMRLYDVNGNKLAFDDNSGVNGNAQLTFIPEYTGTYYVQAGASTFYDQGNYTITANALTGTQASTKTIADPVPTIDWGSAQPDKNVTVYFVPNGESRDVDDGAGTETYTSAGFNAFERAQFQQAFDAISAVSGLSFTIVNDPNADFQLVLDLNTLDAAGDGTLGFFVPPDEGPSTGVGVFNGAAWGRAPGGDLHKGGFGYVTIVHEMLHGLGLAHPHDDGGTSTIMAGVDAPFNDYGTNALNQGVFTTMSYNSGYFTGNGNEPTNPNWGYEAGPMALDIALLQDKYGTGGPHNSGGSTYILPGANKIGSSWQAIWDTGGHDEIRYNGNGDATIDLRAANLSGRVGGGGYVSAVDGIAGGYTIANRVVIEAARGGSGDDTLTGNGADNRVFGRDGDDKILGRDGIDQLMGGNGRDVLYGGGGADQLKGGNGGDVLYGGGGQDLMRGNAGNDRMDGGAAGDNLQAGAGTDQLFGQAGNDILRGGDNRDSLYGGQGADQLFGGQGADQLQGNQGADQLTGGGGADRFVFTAASDSQTPANLRDTIMDFTRGQDRIDLSSIDGARNTPGDQAFDFIGQGGFKNGTIGEVRFQTAKNGVMVVVDVDADGDADMRIFVADVNNLNAGDFIL